MQSGLRGDAEVLCEGRHMLFLRRRGWEYVEHRVAKEAVMIVALTEDGKIALVDPKAFAGLYLAEVTASRGV